MVIIINFITLVSISILFVDVKAPCSRDVSMCHWEPWKPWSECSRTCGVGTRKRYRQYCCKSSLASNVSACMAHCGHDLDYYYMFYFATEDCNTWCYNDGYINRYNSCTCGDTTYGTCCEKNCEEIENCKRRRCTSQLDNICMEFHHEKTISNNDTKCENHAHTEEEKGIDGVLVAGIVSGSLICIVVGIIGLVFFRRLRHNDREPKTKTEYQNNQSQQETYTELDPEHVNVNMYSQIQHKPTEEDKRHTYVDVVV